MAQTWKHIRIWAVILSLCVLALGVVLIVWPDVSALAVCIILGICCIGIGIVDIVRYIKLGLYGIFFRYDLILSICSILVGLLILVRSSSAVTFLPIAVGVYLIIGSVLCIQLAIELHQFHGGGWLLAMIWGIIGLVLAFMLLLDPFTERPPDDLCRISLDNIRVQELYLLISISALWKGANANVQEPEWKLFQLKPQRSDKPHSYII